MARGCQCCVYTRNQPKHLECRWHRETRTEAVCVFKSLPLKTITSGKCDSKLKFGPCGLQTPAPRRRRGLEVPLPTTGCQPEFSPALFLPVKASGRQGCLAAASQQGPGQTRVFVSFVFCVTPAAAPSWRSMHSHAGEKSTGTRRYRWRLMTVKGALIEQGPETRVSCTAQMRPQPSCCSQGKVGPSSTW